MNDCTKAAENMKSIRKFTLVTNVQGYGMRPEPGKEIEQHLTVSSNGRCSLASYGYDKDFCKHRLRSAPLLIPEENIMSLLRLLRTRFVPDFKECFVAGCGKWTLSLTDSNNAKWIYCGAVLDDSFLEHWSGCLRVMLHIPNLLALDGNPQQNLLTKVVLRCRAPKKYFMDAVSEQITMKRCDGSIEYTRKCAGKMNILHRCSESDRLFKLMGRLQELDFPTKPKEIPDDMIEEERAQEIFHFTAYYYGKEKKILEGRLDRYGLPCEFWMVLMEIEQCFQRVGYAPLRDRDACMRIPRRRSDLMFCGVCFDDSGNEYHYLCEDHSVEESDWVIVPVGKENQKTVMRVNSVEFCQPEDSPYPVDKIKKVIRKCTFEEIVEMMMQQGK